jgi:lipopolysaccharide heptosyltransferase II
VISPSARWETKRWPVEHFSSLTGRLSDRFIITGTEKDRAIAQHIKESSPDNVTDLCGRTDLKGLAALIAGAKAVVSNDSGPMHIAAALRVPLVALFGPTDPDKTGPYGWSYNKELTVIRAPAECGPCFRKNCRDPFCMSDIGVEMVLNELKKYL